MPSTSLLDWLLSLLRDPAARAALLANPDGYLNECGFHDASSADVHEALTLIADRDYGHSDGPHYPPPPPHDYHGDHNPAHYLRNYITNNYTTIQERNTYVDDSVHQNVDTHGGDFHQVIDNDPVVASGDHAVAAGGDIRDSALTTGDGNVIGDHNQAVTGEHNTTAFGSGDASSANLGHTSIGDGGALSLGGDAYGNNTHSDTNTSVRNSGSGSTSVNAAGSHGDAGQLADQHEADSSSHSSYDDHSYTNSHDDVNSHNSASYDDSHNLDVHH